MGYNPVVSHCTSIILMPGKSGAETLILCLGLKKNKKHADYQMLPKSLKQTVRTESLHKAQEATCVSKWNKMVA